MTVLIGIDTGVDTGVAVLANNKLISVESMAIIKAMEKVKGIKLAEDNIMLFIEDARLRKGYYGENADAKRMGVGGVKRDASIWQEFCGYWGIDYVLVAPSKGSTYKGLKGNKKFKRITGWAGRTNEHGRDAAMLIYGRKHV